MLSDTVSRVLALAETRAAAAGRRLATPGDIAAAFAEVGGGSAAHLLELCRLSPDQLVPDRSVPARTQAEEGSASGLFDDTPEGRLRVGDLDRSVFDAIRTAGLLAKSHGEVVGTYALLLGFALTSSRTLRGALAEQGEVGERAYRRLYWAVDPRRHEFSSRTRAALDEAAHTGPDIGEAAVLRALLTDEASSAREILVGLGVDLDRLMRTLGAGDSGS
jgi:ATP-dependent Clp protease ATP-binding subunit ClpA